jgi:selenocysteine-specific elongation factor
VVATAGHVDHGKSTLVRALTAMEPDRWAEERRRGMTIDLGYAWTRLPSGTDVAFVDVPGHQRFIGNMLAGLGPAPAVLFVVAADEGWSPQSEEHLAAIDALGIERGVLAVTRSDLADPGPALADARARLSRSSLGDVAALAVSGATGAGVEELRLALDRIADVSDLSCLPLRLWVDRAFTVRGAGTVVTGTLGSGSVAVGDTVQLRGRQVTVRTVEALGVARDAVSAPARVALNVRGVSREEVARGDVLTAPEGWWWTREVDARLHRATTHDLPAELVMHLGTAALAVRLRPLGGDVVRIRLPRPVPARAGDRAVLRDPGRQIVAAGVQVLDADPPALRRRGAAAARARELDNASAVVDAGRELRRRGAMSLAHLRVLGGEGPPEGAHQVGDWLVAATAWRQWCAAVPGLVEEWAGRHPLDPPMPLAALRHAMQLPTDEITNGIAAASGLQISDGRIHPPTRPATLGPAEDAVRSLESRLRAEPFAAPEAGELAELGLTRRELTAAERTGRLLRLDGDVVLLPSAPDEAVRRLATLDQPFTTSAARQVLATTRRVAIPLLEHLDALGLTERVDANTRRLCCQPAGSAGN